MADQKIHPTFSGPKKRVVWGLFLQIRSTWVRKSRSIISTIVSCNELPGQEDHRIAWESLHHKGTGSCQVATLHHCELKLDLEHKMGGRDG